MTSTFALCLAAPAQAETEPRTSFAWSGTCDEIVAFILVDPAKARALVPGEFTLLIAGGKALVGVTGASCREVVVDGESVGDGRFSDFYVAIEPPADSPTQDFFTNFYAVWHLADQPVVGARQAELGLFGALLPDLRVTFGTGAGLRQAQVSAPWSYSSYKLSGYVAGPPVEIPEANTAWHIGPRGTVRETTTYDHHAGSFGAARLFPAPGSPLERVVGPGPVTVPAGHFPFRFRQKADLT